MAQQAQIPTWGVLMMFVASAVGVYLLGRELIARW